MNDYTTKPVHQAEDVATLPVVADADGKLTLAPAATDGAEVAEGDVLGFIQTDLVNEEPV